MKIAVCLKQAPSTTARIQPAADGKSINLAGVELELSPYDEYALEAALQAKDKAGGEVVALSVGAAGAGAVLTHAFAVGADDALLVQAEGLDAAAAARCAAAAFKSIQPGLVFCGRQAIDDDLWEFPAVLAESLGWPHVSAVCALELSADKATCRRRVEGGEEVLEVALPAVISCDKGLNEPRSPTLKGRLNAKKKQIAAKSPAELGLGAEALKPALEVVSYAPPPEKSPGKIVTAPAPEAAAALVQWLRDEAKVL